MKCPQCGLVSPDSAVRCACGYDFLTRATGGSPPEQSVSAQPVTLRDRIAALFAVAPITSEPIPSEDRPGNVRILRWNYERIFAILCACSCLAFAFVLAGIRKSSARQSTPEGIELWLLVAFLCYAVFLALAGNYWSSLFVTEDVQDLHRSRPRFLLRCAALGLVRFAVAAFVTGVAMALFKR